MMDEEGTRMAYDVAVIGGGPTGASAALFAARAGLSTIVIDADKGITSRALINNHLGYPDGVTGAEIVAQGKDHAIKAGAEWKTGAVSGLVSGDEAVTLTLDGGEEITARDVILALGVNASIAKDAGIETADGTEPRITTIVVTDRDGRSSMPRVWAAGTIAGTSVHTIITAGDGARVAINVVSDLRGERHVDHDMHEVSKG